MLLFLSSRTLGATNSLLDLLKAYPEVILSVTLNEDDENISDPTQNYRVHGSILMSVQRLDTELTKVLQNADCHSNDYIEKYIIYSYLQFSLINIFLEPYFYIFNFIQLFCDLLYFILFRIIFQIISKIIFIIFLGLKVKRTYVLL